MTTSRCCLCRTAEHALARNGYRNSSLSGGEVAPASALTGALCGTLVTLGT
jgi:hypothetical protein